MKSPNDTHKPNGRATVKTVERPRTALRQTRNEATATTKRKQERRRGEKDNRRTADSRTAKARAPYTCKKSVRIESASLRGPPVRVRVAHAIGELLMSGRALTGVGPSRASSDTLRISTAVPPPPLMLAPWEYALGGG